MEQSANSPKQDYEPPRIRRVFAAGKHEPRSPVGEFVWVLAVASARAVTEELRQQQDGAK